MPARSLPVESRGRRRPSGAGFRRTATQMALSRCAIAHRGVDWYFWRGTPAIACVAAQPPCSWHLPEAGQATAGRAQRLKPNGCIDIRLHPVTTTAIRHAQVPAVLDGSAAATSCIQCARGWVFCASACRWREARMGRWQAVGEVRIWALLRGGCEDAGSLINALMRVARSGRGRRRTPRHCPCCVTARWFLLGGPVRPLSAGARARREWISREGVPR